MNDSQPVAQATEDEQKAVAHRAGCLAEIDAMRKCFEALHGVTEEGKRRVIRWLDDAIYRRGNCSIYDEKPPF